MIQKQALSLLFSLLFSSLLVSSATADTQSSKPNNIPLRLGKNMVYGAAHGTLAASSGLFCFCAAAILAQTGRGGGGAGLNINLDGAVTFTAISGGIPSVYGLYRGLRGVYIALQDSYYALTETDDTQSDNQAEEKAESATKLQIN